LCATADPDAASRAIAPARARIVRPRIKASPCFLAARRSVSGDAYPRMPRHLCNRVTDGVGDRRRDSLSHPRRVARKRVSEAGWAWNRTAQRAPRVARTIPRRGRLRSGKPAAGQRFSRPPPNIAVAVEPLVDLVDLQPQTFGLEIDLEILRRQRLGVEEALRLLAPLGEQLGR